MGGMAHEIVVQIERRFSSGVDIRADLRLDLAAGATAILFGPSGSGKTTVLRSIAGLDRPDRGVIRFGDEFWFDSSSGICLSPQLRRVGVLFQDYALFPHLTVRQNIEYGLDDRNRSQRQQIADEMMRLLEITELANRRPRQISGGQAQRVALARAIAPQPRILLLDEPLAALDAPTRTRLRSELRGLLGEIGIPSMLVTHDRTEAISLGHRIVVMAEGKVHQVGPVDEVFRHPSNAAVAKTVGVETILRGTILDTKDGIARVALDKGEVRAVLTEDFRCGDPVLACIRAEEVTLQQEATAGESTRNHFTGAIMSIEPDGPVERVSLDCGFPLVAIVTRKAREEMGLTVGAHVAAAIKATAVHLIQA